MYVYIAIELENLKKKSIPNLIHWAYVNFKENEF